MLIKNIQKKRICQQLKQARLVSVLAVIKGWLPFQVNFAISTRNQLNKDSSFLLMLSK